MGNKLPNILIWSVFVFAIALQGRGETFHVAPGELREVVEELSGSAPAEVVLAGEVSAIDLVALRNLPATVVSLDMSGLTVKGDKLKDATYFGCEEFEDGELPPYFLINTRIKRIMLPAGTRKIGVGAFAEAQVEEVTLPSSLIQIDDYAFYKCAELSSLNIDATEVAAIGKQAFYGCASLTAIQLPSTLQKVGRECFMKSGVQALAIPSLRECGDYAFAEMPGLREVEMSLNPTVGEGAFYGNKLLESFTGTAANSPALLLAESAIVRHKGYVRGEVVEEGAFAGLSVDSVVFYPDVKEVRDNAFRNMRNLQKIDVTGLDDRIPVLTENAFAGIEPSSIHLYVLTGTEEKWLAAEGWKEFVISGRVSDVEDIIDDKNIRISVSDGVVSVSAPDMLTRVDVYSLDGKELHAASPASYDYSAGPFDGEDILIIKAATGTKVRVAKMKNF